ncbi:oligomycin resistance ATP-dependent permease yor1 [Xylariales sp. PMI_506]|nr:oligomycin resistance ATP-dependent permease yor1 [Xylariales sp. PMI_506]
MCIASAAPIATGSSYMAISVPVLVISVFGLQHIYLRTSRQLRVLDIEARSPLTSHFIQSLNGLVTIRAFGWQSEFIDESHRLLDYSQQPYYLMYCIQRWLTLVLDLIVGAEAILVVGLAIGWGGSTSPERIGVSLNNVLSFSNSLSAFISGLTLLETSLASIARLKSFEEVVKPEDKTGENHAPPPTWPDHGTIVFEDVVASHGQVIAEQTPGQKAGICGRTGSGKGSLVATLLRLLEIDSGKILIDGLDLSTIPRDTIRGRLLVIPQDPLMLAGSLRMNLDPHVAHPDDDIRAVLDRVGLKTLVRDLDTDVFSSTLSPGEKQLLALARTLLKSTRGGGSGSASCHRILLLDEATSNVDAETDTLLQRVIREEFKDYTVLTVAHGLDTIMDSDVIVVMDEGTAVEVGSPVELLQGGGGWFAGLVGQRT